MYKSPEPCCNCGDGLSPFECPECGPFLLQARRLTESTSPYRDNVQGCQKIAELTAVRDWAEVMKAEHSICEIKHNPDEPPDCFATMDGKPIGIEVTDLFELGAAPPSLTTSQFKKLLKAEFGKAAEPGAKKLFEYQKELWPLERFQAWLAKTVRTKNAKTPRASSLDEQFLLIVICRYFHSHHPVQRYLNEITLPQPSNFDRVYMMADINESDDTGGGPYPLFRVTLSLNDLAS